MITENKSNKAIALKLRHQFAYCKPDKLINLINNAEISYSNNNELKEEIQKISKNFFYAKYTRKHHQDLLWDYLWSQHYKRW